jgi:hypothetical protein
MAAERGRWIKACDTSACVEVMIGEDTVYVARTRELDMLMFNSKEWDEFVTGVKAGKFDRA